MKNLWLLLFALPALADDVTLTRSGGVGFECWNATTNTLISSHSAQHVAEAACLNADTDDTEHEVRAVGVIRVDHKETKPDYILLFQHRCLNNSPAPGERIDMAPCIDSKNPVSLSIDLPWTVDGMEIIAPESGSGTSLLVISDPAMFSTTVPFEWAVQ